MLSNCYFYGNCGSATYLCSRQSWKYLKDKWRNNRVSQFVKLYEIWTKKDQVCSKLKQNFIELIPTAGVRNSITYRL